MYFIQDPTRVAKGTTQDYVFVTESIPDFIQYLEGLVQRKLGFNRAQFLAESSDLSGETNTGDEVFYDAVKNYKIRMGVVRKGGSLVECDVLREHRYSSNRAEYGD